MQDESREKELVGGYTFAAGESEKGDSSVKLSIEENLEDVNMMERAANDLITGGVTDADTEKTGDADLRKTRLNMLKKQLIGPEIELLEQRVDQKGVLKMEQLKMEINTIV